MFSTKELIEELENLASDLELSGKAESARFFRNIIADFLK